jgi:transcriptional/translational regulatory protein YebC/TACO1
VAPVGFLFERKGSVRMLLSASDDVLEKVLASGAEDFDEVGRSDGAVEMIVRDASSLSATPLVPESELQFTCPPNELAALTSQLSSLGDGCEVLASELVYMPKDAAETLDGGAQSRIAELKEALEEDPDCLRVWTTVRT